MDDGSQPPAYPLALRPPAPVGAFGGAVKDELGRSLARGAVKVSTTAIVLAGVYLIGRALWRAGVAWWQARRSGASAIGVREVVTEPAPLPAPRASVASAGVGVGGVVSEPLRAPKPPRKRRRRTA